MQNLFLSTVSYVSTSVNLCLKMYIVNGFCRKVHQLANLDIENERKYYCAAPNKSHNLNTYDTANIHIEQWFPSFF